MKNLFTGMVVACVATQAMAEFNVETSDALRESCAKTVERTYQVGSEPYEKTLFTTYLSNDGDKYISNSRTRITIWVAEPDILGDCLEAADWIRKSDVAPSGVEVHAAAAECTFSAPQEDHPVDVQIVYEIGYSDITETGSSDVVKQFLPSSSALTDPFQEITYQNYRSVPSGVDAPACFNINLEH